MSRVTEADVAEFRRLREHHGVKAVARMTGFAHSTVLDYLTGRRVVNAPRWDIVDDPELGPVRRCLTCKEWWPCDDDEFYVNDGHGSCLACEAEKRRTWESRKYADPTWVAQRRERNRRDHARRRAA